MEEDQAQSLTYLIEIVNEQLGLVKWQEELLHQHMKEDIELMDSCFKVLR